MATAEQTCVERNSPIVAQEVFMWKIQIQWFEQWVTVEQGFASQGDAEWRTAQWKQSHRCTGDPFRVVKSSEISQGS